VGQRTGVINQIRGFLIECGITVREIKDDGFRVTGSAFYRLALAGGEARA
jgi:hypothetical protein